jgi:hypothetical protein
LNLDAIIAGADKVWTAPRAQSDSELVASLKQLARDSAEVLNGYLT